jgi:hypothetical protein
MTAPTHATEVEHIMTNPGPEHPPTVKEPAGDHAMPTRDHAASQASTGGAYAATAYHTTPRHDLDLLTSGSALEPQEEPRRPSTTRNRAASHLEEEEEEEKFEPN